MTGQIPPYGEHFRRESVPWTPDLANRVYVLKLDDRWFIRSDKTSGIWRVYHWHLDHDRELAAPVGTPLPTFGLAMTRLLDGIEQGFYAITGPGDALLTGDGALAPTRSIRPGRTPATRKDR